MSRPRAFRRGDLVRIVTPEVFLRCGYPLTTTDLLPDVERMFGDSVDDLVDDCAREQVGAIATARARAQILRALAYVELRRRKMGGPERTLHLLRVPRLAGVGGTVTGRRVVQTGTYVPTIYSDDGRGGDVWCPSHLSGVRAHVILTVEPLSMRDHPRPEDFGREETTAAPWSAWRLPAAHVEMRNRSVHGRRAPARAWRGNHEQRSG